MELSIEAYAALSVQLAAAADARDEVLAQHGLDEDQWDAIDSDWQDRLTADFGDGDGVPALLAIYSAAYQQAQSALGPPISLVRFARVTRFFQASGDLQAALAKEGVTFVEYLRSNEHWTRRLTENPDEEQQFCDALRGDASTRDGS